MLELCCKLAETIQCKDCPARCACRGDEKCKKTIVCYSDWMKWLKKTNKQNDAINLYTTFRCLIDWLGCDGCVLKDQCEELIANYPDLSCVDYYVDRIIDELMDIPDEWLERNSDVWLDRNSHAKPSKTPSDEIRPDWYKITPGIEAWDVINPILNRCDYTGECIGYLKDILKYVLRADQKNGLEDYKKAYTNLKQLIRVLEEGEKE